MEIEQLFKHTWTEYITDRSQLFQDERAPDFDQIQAAIRQKLVS